MQAGNRERRVRVWFGSHVIAEYAAESEEAEEYATAMQRKFFGLRVTNDLLRRPMLGIHPLLARHWWQVPPQ